MARNKHIVEDVTPAAAMREALAGMTRQMHAAAPDRAGRLAVKIAALAQDLALEEARAAEAAQPTMEELVERRAAFDAQVERMIFDRVEERLSYLAAPQSWDMQAQAMRQAIIAGDRDWRKFMEVQEEA